MPFSLEPLEFSNKLLNEYNLCVNTLLLLLFSNIIREYNADISSRF